MIKKICYYAIIIVIVLLVLPLLFGVIAEKKCRNLVASANVLGLINTKLVKYKRGWFSSKTTLKVSTQANDLYPATIDVRIKHGPFSISWSRFRLVQAVAKATINISPEWDSLLGTKGSSTEIVKARLRIKLNGAIDLSLEMPKLDYSHAEDSLSIKGLQLGVFWSAGHNMVRFNLIFMGAEGIINSHGFNLGEVIWNCDGLRSANGLWVGERVMRIKSGWSRNANNHTVSFSNFYLKDAMVSTEENRGNFALTTTLEDLTVNNASFKNNNVTFEVTNLNPELLTTLRKLSRIDSILISPKSVLLDAVVFLLSNGSAVKIRDVSSHTPWGKLSGDAAIIRNAPSNSVAAIGWLSTLASSNVEVIINTEETLLLYVFEKFYDSISPGKNKLDPATRAKNNFDELLREGKLSRNNERILDINIRYNNNQVTINGKPLTISIQ